eukprot:g297.t1
MMRQLIFLRYVYYVAAILTVATGTFLSSSSRIYPEFTEPLDNPILENHHILPPSSKTFPRGHVRFSGYRGGCSEKEFLSYLSFDIGDVWWPQYPVLSGNLGACLDLVTKYNLTMVDVSNYVPGDTDVCDGSAPANSGVCEYHLPLNISNILANKLGETFTGMDNGEQDGRYVGRYAGEQPSRAGSSTRTHHYLNFLRHFRRMTDDLGSKMMSLNSLFYTHAFARTGLYTGLAAETAQGLPNAQIFYSFLRGAMKQFATLLWGNISVYNRFGYKQCTATGCDASGTSLALMKKLMIAQLVYGVSFFGLEAFLTDGDALTPIGILQKAGKEVAEAYLSECVHLSTVAIVIDIESGFAPPRHLYAGDDLYRVWGSLPYDRGDHFTHGVLDLFYPKYVDSSYFHDERAFSTPTPYGDIVDVLNTDAAPWLLKRYSLIVYAGAATRSGLLRAEIRSNILAAKSSGASVVVAADTLLALSGEEDDTGADMLTVRTDGRVVGTARSVTCFGDRSIQETTPFDVVALRIDTTTTTYTTLCTATLSESENRVVPVVVRTDDGLVVLGTDGISKSIDPDINLPMRTVVDKTLASPYPLLKHVALVLDVLVRDVATTVKAASETVTSTTCRKSVSEYIVAVTNPFLNESRMTGSEFENNRRHSKLRSMLKSSFVSGIGNIQSVEEILLDAKEKDVSPGYLPQGFENVSLGKSTNSTIAGADTRLFRVHVNETAALIRSVPARPRGKRHVALRLPTLSYAADPVVDDVRLRPTFFRHYDAVVVEWSFFLSTTSAALESLDRWSSLRDLRIIVDFTSGINLYPDLRLCKNSIREFEESVATIEGVLKIMSDLKCARDAVFSFHNAPENYYSDAQCEVDFDGVAERLNAFALQSAPAVTLHLRTDFAKPPHSLVEAASYATRDRVSWKLAPSTALLGLHSNVTDAASLNRFLKSNHINPKKIGLLFAGAPLYDRLTNSLLSIRGSLSQNPASAAAAAALSDALPGSTLVHSGQISSLKGGREDASHSRRVDFEYLEASAVEKFWSPASRN